jgi:SnoaL-like domain
MDDREIRAALERHWADIEDQAVVHEIYRDDVVMEFPQSGERIVGVANLRAMRDAYPARLTFAIQRMRGSGDFWVTEGVITYDGRPMRTVTIMEFRGGKVAHETIYFGEPWEPPAWRARWVEPTARPTEPSGGTPPR